MIAGSYSRLDLFEKCPLQFRLKNITKDIKYVENEALREGKRKHKILEEAVKREQLLSKGHTCMPVYEDLQHMRPLVKGLVTTYSGIETELELAFRRDWSTCDWFDKDTWFRCIIDLAGIRGTSGFIIDWKSGKVRVTDKQLIINNAIALTHWPHLNDVTASLVFIDHGEFSNPVHMKRTELPEVMDSIDERMEAIQIAEERGSWPPTPGHWCRWCDATPALCEEKRRM